MSFEYSVVPAPKKGVKARGVKSTEDRFAYALQTIMNEKGAEGWEYVRTDTLPSEERQGLTGRSTTYQNMMVFRRSLTPQVEEVAAPTALLAAPVRAPDVEPAPEPQLSAQDSDTMMSLDNTPLDDDPLRAEPRMRAE